MRERRTYSELSSKAKRLAGALAQRGVDQKTIVVSNVPNTANNLLLQLALSHLGAAVATAKVSGLMRALVTFWLSRMRSQRFQRTHTRKTRTVHGETYRMAPRSTGSRLARSRAPNSRAS